MPSTYFLLADGQDIARAGIRHYLETSGSDYVAVDVKHEQGLCAELVKRPDAVVVLDYTTFDIPSVDGVINLRQRFPMSRWVLFSDELTPDSIRHFATEGSISIILKANAEEEIRSAIACAVKGERFLCHQIANFLIEERTRKEAPGKLTATEVEVLKLIAKGKSVKEIAAERHSSTHTIITHKKNIFRKIEVNNVHEATKYALHAGLVDLMEYYI